MQIQISANSRARAGGAAHKGECGGNASGADHPLQAVLSFSSEGYWRLPTLGAAAVACTSRKQTDHCAVEAGWGGEEKNDQGKCHLNVQGRTHGPRGI